MGRDRDAVDIIYEDEELATCCKDVLPAVEKFLIKLDKILPSYIKSDFFVELVDKIRNNLLSGDKILKRKLMEGKMGVVTVTFDLGSDGLNVAKAIGKQIGYKVVFNEILTEVARRLNVPEWEIESFNEFKYVSSKLSLFHLFQVDRNFIDLSAILGRKEKKELTLEQFREALTKTVVSMAVSNNVVIVGHAAPCILKEYPNSLHIKIEAPFEDRVKVYAERTGVSLDEAKSQLEKIDEKEQEFYKDNCIADITKIDLFHLKLNTSKLSVEDATEIAVKAFDLVVKR